MWVSGYLVPLDSTVGAPYIHHIQRLRHMCCAKSLCCSSKFVHSLVSMHCCCTKVRIDWTCSAGWSADLRNIILEGALMPFTQVTDHHQIGTVSTLCADVEHPEATSCKLSHLTWKYRPGTKRVAAPLSRNPLSLLHRILRHLLRHQHRPKCSAFWSTLTLTSHSL